jgi:hypothetical protein
MERVTFIIESSDTQLTCLLNPESLTVQRNAGIRPRHSLQSAVSVHGWADDAWLCTGGGRTIIDFELLFDVQLNGSTIHTNDVRELTAPFSELAENIKSDDGEIKIPQIRFVWGKNWNIPGIITHVAERFERFTLNGMPQRSWLKMRFIRVSGKFNRFQPSTTEILKSLDNENSEDIFEEGDFETYRVKAGDRLDLISEKYFGSPAQWRLLANENDIVDPLNLAEGILIRIPRTA